MRRNGERRWGATQGRDGGVWEGEAPVPAVKVSYGPTVRRELGHSGGRLREILIVVKLFFLSGSGRRLVLSF
jgi:hypothetical protein